MGGDSSGGGSGDTQNTIRYAPYLEEIHSELLDHGGSDEPTMSFIDSFNAIVSSSPYSTHEVVDVDEGYFGMTVDDPSITYEMKNYPSLWDMFGKFMAGLDVHVLWAQIYSDVVQGPEIENAVTAQSDMIQDEIDISIMPKFLAGMRDIGSVHSTAFVVGKAIIQNAHVKSINEFSSKIRLHAMTMSNDQWSKHLSWNESVIRVFSEMFKLYYTSRLDVNKDNFDYQAKDLMWGMNLFENARGILGAMSGGAATAGQNEPSQTQKSLGSTMSGAAAGFMVGGPVGAVAGGILGLGSSFL